MALLSLHLRWLEGLPPNERELRTVEIGPLKSLLDSWKSYEFELNTWKEKKEKVLKSFADLGLHNPKEIEAKFHDRAFLKSLSPELLFLAQELRYQDFYLLGSKKKRFLQQLEDILSQYKKVNTLLKGTPFDEAIDNLEEYHSGDPKSEPLKGSYRDPIGEILHFDSQLIDQLKPLAARAAWLESRQNTREREQEYNILKSAVELLKAIETFNTDMDFLFDSLKNEIDPSKPLEDSAYQFIRESYISEAIALRRKLKDFLHPIHFHEKARMKLERALPPAVITAIRASEKIIDGFDEKLELAILYNPSEYHRAMQDHPHVLRARKIIDAYNRLEAVDRENLTDPLPREKAQLELTIAALTQEHFNNTNEAKVHLSTQAGGDRGRDFLDKMVKLYQALAKSRGWVLKIVTTNPSNVTLQVSGDGVLPFFEAESGIHDHQSKPLASSRKSERVYSSEVQLWVGAPNKQSELSRVRVIREQDGTVIGNESDKRRISIEDFFKDPDWLWYMNLGNQANHLLDSIPAP